MLGDPVEAQDAVHDAAVAAWQRFDGLRDHDRFEPWFDRILVNGCRDRLRARRRRPVVDLAVTPDEDLPRTPDHAAGVAAADAVERAIRALGGRGAKGRRGSPMARGCASALIFTIITIPLASWLLAQGGVGAGRYGDRVVAGSVVAPGPEVSEVVDDGIVIDETTESWDKRGVDRYVYRVAPGQAFSYVVSVRNASQLPITILGLPVGATRSVGSSPGGKDYLWSGLGLLRDPAVVSSAPGDVVPFHAVNLASGEALALVVAAVGGSCADPSGGPMTETTVYGATLNGAGHGLAVEYDVLGWRIDGFVTPQVHVSVPVRPGCLADEP